MSLLPFRKYFEAQLIIRCEQLSRIRDRSLHSSSSSSSTASSSSVSKLILLDRHSIKSILYSFEYSNRLL